MDFSKMTMAERLAIIKKELFEGFKLEDVTRITESDRRQLLLMHAERILGLKPGGEAARYYATEVYGEKIGAARVKDSFLYAPQEDVDGFISDTMRLLACLLDGNPWGNCFSLRWLSGHFDAADGDDPNQFSPKNERLMVWLEKTVDRRIAALVANMVQMVFRHEMEKVSVAISDFVWDVFHDIKTDWANVEDCNYLVNRLFDAISDVEMHIDEGREMGLSIEEIGLVDSLWCDVDHCYPEAYVAAANEIWQKVKAVRDNFAEGRKTYDDCKLFTNDMLQLALPIAEKYEIDMELDDEHSLPLSYLKEWLLSIYYGDDPIFG